MLIYSNSASVASLERCDVEELVLACDPYIRQPICGYTHRQQRIVTELGEQRRLLRDADPERVGCRLERSDLLRPLTDLHDLDGSRGRVGLDAPPFRPCIGLVVMIDIGDEEAVRALVDDQAKSRPTRTDQKFGSLEASIL